MKYIKDKYGYTLLFDEKSGIAIRGDFEGKNIFWKQSGPELLDISITNYCDKGCDFCYRQSNVNGKFMSIQLFKKIILDAQKLGVYQIAIGGGNPNQHPHFIDFLKISRLHGIVPSYTTNGIGMTNDIYYATKQFAGAVAVSWYKPYELPESVIRKCFDLKIPINIHFVLNNDNIKQAYELINNDIVNFVNAIIFLTYKPVGKVKHNVLTDSHQLKSLLLTLTSYDRCKIGFDSCMISHLVKHDYDIDPESIDFCEAARFSAFISEEGLMYPCSFMSASPKFGCDLSHSSMIDIWKNSEVFVKLRDRLHSPNDKCIGCSHYISCHGGCPFFDINCSR